MWEHMRGFREMVKYLINNYAEASRLKKCNIFQLFHLSFAILKALSENIFVENQPTFSNTVSELEYRY